MSDDGDAPVPGGPGGTSMPPTPGGGGGRVADDRAAALVAYLEANRGRYTDEALRRAATSAGYTNGEVDAALVALASGPPITPDQGLRARARMAVAISVAILYVVGVYLVMGLLGSRAQNELFLWAFLVAEVAGLIGWALLRERRPSLALGLGLGVILAVVLPVVLFLVLLGMCIVAGGTPFGLNGG
jgi:hypothetical protein